MRRLIDVAVLTIEALSWGEIAILALVICAAGIVAGRVVGLVLR